MHNRPNHNVLDIKGLYLEGGLSAPLIAQMRRHLNRRQSSNAVFKSSWFFASVDVS